jgi:xanthine dehydrogenase large subunit
MKHIESRIHVRGETHYVDDLPLREGTLFGAVFDSPYAHGRITKLDTSAAEAMHGVVAVITAADVPGENQIGSIIQDEELFAEGEVHYVGMPVALVVAEDLNTARAARKEIVLEVEELPAVFAAREARARELFISPPRTFAQGSVDAAWDDCDVVVSGTAEMGGQEHLYLETHGSYVWPGEDGNLKVFSSTQAPWYVQKGIAKVLGLPLHKIEVDVARIGGGFGGKEDQGTPWATMTALAVQQLGRPVKLVLHRLEDIRMSGKRHPYSFDFRIGLTRDHKIRAWDVTAYQNAGASADVSPAVMERTLFHGCGSYFIPNARVTVYSCRTNLPVNTAFRGFGAPQAMYVMESAITAAATAMGVDRAEIQRANLLTEGDTFHYGQTATLCNAGACWDKAADVHGLAQLRAEIDEFNRTHETHKQGLALFPLCFGISFTKTSLNQAGSLVHVYSDGSVSVTTGVIEMGQGVNTKMAQVAQRTLGVDAARIKVDTTNTTRIANASPTAASSGADLNGKATEMACTAIRDRLLQTAAEELGCDDVAAVGLRDERVFLHGEPTELTWPALVMATYEKRRSLSEHAWYATPGIDFDKGVEKGSPFAYHSYGTAITTVTLDCVRGTYVVDAVRIVHDFGSSINEGIDRGQIEGALMQGIGLMSIEELTLYPDGSLKTNSLASYKIPDIYTAPGEVEIVPLGLEGPPRAILGSKAVGEPPLCYGISTYFAVQDAMKAFNPECTIRYEAPMTYQQCLLALYPDARWG